MNSVYYFVVYEHRPKGQTELPRIDNGILKDVHPVVWAANPPDGYAKHFLTYLHFWVEIPEEVALEADKKRYITIEQTTQADTPSPDKDGWHDPNGTRFIT